MTLYIDNCRTCSNVRESLNELAMACDVVVVSQDGQANGLPQGTHPPVLVDGDRVVQGGPDIFSYIDELQEFKREWLKYQSDACYID